MELYEQIELTIRQHAEYINVGNSVTETEVRHAIRWVMRNNPDIFWFVHQYHFDKDNGIVSFRYRCSPERSAIIQESIDDVVVNDFKIAYVHKLSQLEQVAYVYKWILTYCNYNTNSAYNQNILTRRHHNYKILARKRPERHPLLILYCLFYGLRPLIQQFQLPLHLIHLGLFVVLTILQ